MAELFIENLPVAFLKSQPKRFKLKLTNSFSLSLSNQEFKQFIDFGLGYIKKETPTHVVLKFHARYQAWWQRESGELTWEAKDKSRIDHDVARALRSLLGRLIAGETIGRRRAA